LEQSVIAGSGLELDNVEFAKMAFEDPSFPDPIEGFRYIYVDELLNNEDFN
jgi:hypothetical protein